MNATNVSQLALRWNITGHGVTSTPIVSNGNVYFGDWGGDVYSANLSTGKINWVVNFGTQISSTPSVSGGKLFVAFGPGRTQVVALNENNGKVLWHDYMNTTSKSIWSSPLIYGGKVYIGIGGGGPETNSSIKGEFDALNATTGKLIWRFVTMVGTSGGAAVWGSAVIDSVLGEVYFGTGNAYTQTNSSLYSYSIIALNATNGKLKWYYQAYPNYNIGKDNDFGSTPNLFSVYINGTYYNAIGLGSKGGNYYVLNRVTGKLLEKFYVGMVIGAAGVTCVPGPKEIFVPIVPGYMAALFPRNDTIAWKEAFSPIIGSVAVVPGAVLFGTTGNSIVALSFSGTVLARIKVPCPANGCGQIEGGVSVAEGFVLVGTGDNGTTGPEFGLWAYST